jgi:hypothetical protein
VVHDGSFLYFVVIYLIFVFYCMFLQLFCLLFVIFSDGSCFDTEVGRCSAIFECRLLKSKINFAFYIL